MMFTTWPVMISPSIGLPSGMCARIGATTTARNTHAHNTQHAHGQPRGESAQGTV
jgi:hypothetical protein